MYVRFTPPVLTNDVHPSPNPAKMHGSGFVQASVLATIKIAFNPIQCGGGVRSDLLPLFYELVQKKYLSDHLQNFLYV